jgi:two-component system, chemotaxis family, response regulator Rcp1
MRSTELRAVEILLVEDNAADVRLMREAFADAKIRNHLHVASDGDEALAFLRREGRHASSPRPDLVLLDLNMPRKNGREVLSEIRRDPVLKIIPVVVMTTSDAERDISAMYGLGANCYVIKPLDLDDFTRAVRGIEDFWLTIVRLPAT